MLLGDSVSMHLVQDNITLMLDKQKSHSQLYGESTNYRNIAEEGLSTRDGQHCPRENIN